MSSMEWTTISIKRKTRNALAKLGTKDTSFDDILQILLENWRQK